MGLYVKNGESVSLVPGGVPQDVIERIEKDIAELRELRAGLDNYGLAKISESDSITDSCGLVLGASEKNASVEGTLANRIEKNNERIQSVTNGVEQLNRITNIKRFTLKGAGWYRIAAYRAGNVSYANGAQANGCGIVLRRSYDADDNEYHHLELASVYTRSAFHKIAELANTKIITRIRHTVDTGLKTAFIEIYYGSEHLNSIFVLIENGQDKFHFWEAIEPVPAQETAGGVLVNSRLELGDS